MGFLANKRILITGMISTRSIAYGIAQAMHREGAQLAFTYQGERVLGRVKDMAQEFGSELIFQCDVGNDNDINQLFVDLGKHWDGFDGFVHAIAFAPREALDGEFLDGFSREAFRVAHDISAYSFPAMAKAALPMMQGRKAALLTIEGERDDISGVGQTEAAHRLCVNIPPERKAHYMQRGVGHYGVFNGSRFRAEIAPRIADFIRSNDARAPAVRKPHVRVVA